MLYGRISLGLDLVLEGRVAGFSRHIDAVAVHVELPAVIDATQPTFFIATKEHPRPAMWAERINDADRTMAVAEGHQVFTEHAQPHRRPIRFWQFLGHQHRVPEAAEQLAHRCSGTRPGQEFVVAQTQHSTPPMTPLIFCCAIASRRPIMPAAPDPGTTRHPHGWRTSSMWCVGACCGTAYPSIPLPFLKFASAS
jgi:hypothetical protein